MIGQKNEKNSDSPQNKEMITESMESPSAYIVNQVSSSSTSLWSENLTLLSTSIICDSQHQSLAMLFAVTQCLPSH